jgi:hypothetical protein
MSNRSLRYDKQDIFRQIIGEKAFLSGYTKPGGSYAQSHPCTRIP